MQLRRRRRRRLLRGTKVLVPSFGDAHVRRNPSGPCLDHAVTVQRAALAIQPSTGSNVVLQTGTTAEFEVTRLTVPGA